MRALAQSYVWWLGLNQDIEDWVMWCKLCQESRSSPPKAPTNSWESPQTPWSEVHVDFVRLFQGQTFMVTVDLYSK